MKTRGARLLYDYWREARGRFAVPRRDAIEPRGLKSVLPWVFILDHVDLELTVFRLAGTGVCDFYGRELRGENFLSQWTGDCRRTVRSLIQNVVMMPTPSTFEFTAEGANGRLLSGDIMLLPMESADGELQQVLGGWFPAVTHDPLLEKPIMRQRMMNIRLLELPDGTELPPIEPEPADARAKLRLVVSNGD